MQGWDKTGDASAIPLLCQNRENKELYQPLARRSSHQKSKKDMKLVELHELSLTLAFSGI
ncbi:hypothetical protein [Methanolobus sp.]|uniref:hypothetical protein n=1 Tax=Methanolobus sp. TaxID=1874737 RepID=UPI0025ED84DA|nr:hypothetical protein [Methanolobus sp.]